jgi:Rrf2 family protein
MLELGIHYGNGPVFLKDIAKNEAISEKYLSQIIIPLKSAGLVGSFRGSRGGYVLTRPPQEITLKDIVEVLEGGFELLGCLREASLCSRVSVCVTRDVWANLGETIARMLDSISLADLIKRYKEKKQKVFMYNI